MGIKREEIQTKNFYWRHPHADLAPVNTIDLRIGWIKLATTPFIELFKIQVQTESFWANPATSTRGYSFNKTLVFRTDEWSSGMIHTYLHVSVPSQFVEDYEWDDTGQTCVKCDSGNNPIRNTYWRYLENPVHEFHGSIFPSQLHVVSGIGGSDNILIYTKDLYWSVNITFREYRKKTHPLAALIQRRRFHF